MRFVRYLILALIVICLVTMAMANREMVTLELLTPELAALTGIGFSITLPLYAAILGGVAVGVLLGFVLEWIRESKHRSEVAKRQRQVKTLNKEVSRLKQEQNQGKDEVLALLDDSARRKAV